MGEFYETRFHQTTWTGKRYVIRLDSIISLIHQVLGGRAYRYIWVPMVTCNGQKLEVSF